MTKKDVKSDLKFFLNLPQYKILNDESEAMKRLILIAEVGTGKSVLLREKAKWLLEKNQKVVVVIFGAPYENSTKESLLTTQYRQVLSKAVKPKQDTPTQQWRDAPQLQPGPSKKRRKSKKKFENNPEHGEMFDEQCQSELKEEDGEELVHVIEITKSGKIFEICSQQYGHILKEHFFESS